MIGVDIHLMEFHLKLTRVHKRGASAKCIMLLLQLQFVRQLELLGSAKNVTPVELAVPVLQEAVKRGGVEPHEVDEVILGHCIQRTDEANTARTAALAAGFPDTVTGYTIQRQCSSGMQAIMSAAMQIQLGVSEVVVAGGVKQ